jgi:hypothetical protein
MPSSGARDEQLSQCFQESATTFQNTTKERCSITAQHAISNTVAQAHLTPSSIRELSPDVTTQDAEEGAKGGKKICM